jgi:hypothetical protein
MATRLMTKAAVGAAVASLVAGLWVTAYGALAAGATGATASAPVTTATGPAGVVVLRMAPQWGDARRDFGGTIWRYYETWRTDVVRGEDGQVTGTPTQSTALGTPTSVEPYVFRQETKGGDAPGKTFQIAPAKTVTGSAFPPEGWQRSDFDDGNWQRQPGPLRTLYRSIALTCVRGRFEVRDPAAVSDLKLELSFQGGAVAYLNGQEVGRAGLPQGKLDAQTLADEYPKETYENGLSKSRNSLLNQSMYGGEVAGPGRAGELCRDVPPDEKARFIERYQKRFRTLSARIPASALRKGVNVLAIEVHRAPANPVMFTAVRFQRDTDGNMISTCAWNRCMVDDVTLTATAESGAILPNISRPAGMQVWNASTQMMLLPTHYGDPNEPLRPVRLAGLPNGMYSGRLVVSSDKAIAGLKAGASELKSPQGGVIPAANVQIGYERWVSGESNRLGTFEAIDKAAPDPVAADVNRHSDGWAPYKGAAMQPIWITVNVPRDAKAGLYAGKVTVEAAGEKAVEVPLTLRVVSDWALPDPH